MLHFIHVHFLTFFYYSQMTDLGLFTEDFLNFLHKTIELVDFMPIFTLFYHRYNLSYLSYEDKRKKQPYVILQQNATSTLVS